MRVQARRSALASTLLWVAATAVAVILVLPGLLVIPFSLSSASFLEFPPQELSLRWYETLFTDSGWMSSVGNSLQVGLIAAAVACVFGTTAALGLATIGGRFESIFKIPTTIPMYVPVIVLAVGFYSLFAKLNLVGNILAIGLAHAVICIPVVMLSVGSALSARDHKLEEAARSMGAGPIRVFWSVTLPGIRIAIASGTFFAFLLSFDEFVIALFLSDTGSTTLPVQMWSTIRYQNEPTIAAAGVLLMLISATSVIVAEVIRFSSERRRRRRMPASDPRPQTTGR